MLIRKENIILQKSQDFADRIVKLYTYLTNKGERIMSKQILRCGTSIGANVSEGQYAQSTADFLSKLSIALKEANECRFWLIRLHSGDFIDDRGFSSLLSDNEEIIRLLISITKTVKEHMNNK